MSDIQKMCVLCGRSCSGQARIKNAKGQYAHKACVEAKRQARDEAPGEEYNDALGGGIEDVLGDLAAHEESAPAAFAADSADACPGCGIRMAPGAVICMGCGYNAQLGKLMPTKRMEAGEGIGGKLGEGAGAMGGLAAGPVLPLIGALIGGAIGAGIWAAIVYFTGYEVGFVAILVGALCGVGATLGGGAQTTGGGLLAGVMAAVVAVAAIGTGKFIAIEMTYNKIVGQLIDEQLAAADVDDNWALSAIAYEHCQKRIDAGETIDWGDPALYADAAYWPNDYPDSFQGMVNDKWDSMDDRQRIAFRTAVAEEDGLDSYHEVDEDWALSAMAYKAAHTMIENGETIDWPDPNLPHGSVSWPDQYPAQIRDRVNRDWESMDEAARLAHRQKLAERVNEARKAMGGIGHKVSMSGMVNSFKSPLQILFVVLAIGAAFRIGANGE